MLKKLLLFLGLLFATPLLAQIVPASANLTASDTGLCTTPGACLVVNMAANYASSVVQITGTFSGTVQFEGTTSQGGTFVAVNAFPLNSTTAVTSATAVGAWRITVSGLAQLRVRCSTYSSGTIAVALTGSVASAGNSGGGGGGSGITALTTDVLASGTGSVAATVVGINNTLLSSLATGLLKNTTTTGVPSIAVAGTDYVSPTGSAGGLTGYPWSSLAVPSGNLSLAMASNSSIFNTTSAVSQFFAWKNTTAATVSVSQASPTLGLCGRAWHGSADVEDCLTFQETPGTGNDGAITFTVGHTGTSTGIATTTFPGPIQAGTASAPGTIILPGNASGTCSVVANSVGICAPGSGSFTNFTLQLSSTPPSGNQVLQCGTPSSNISPCAFVSQTGAVSSVSNSDGTLTISPTTGAVVASIALGHVNTWTGAQTWAALGTFSGAGAASTPGLTVTGAPYTGGSATTNFPQFYINSGTGPTTFSTAGTAFGINAPSGFAGNLEDHHINGGASVYSILYTGLGLFGTGALAPTLGTSGGIFAIEGTAPTGASTNYGWYNDSTLHCFDIIDQTTNIGCGVGEASILSANVIPKASGTTSKIAASLLSDNGSTLTYTGATGVAFTPPITTYNNIATVSNGVPSELATIDLTGQTAAKTATALYTPTATGLFRVCYYSKVTTAATTSSILGGTTGLVLAYTDGTDSVAQTAFTLPSTSQAGNTITIGTGNTTNTTQATVNGCGVIYAKTGVGITYAFGYTSVGGTPMAYELHIKAEAQ